MRSILNSKNAGHDAGAAAYAHAMEQMYQRYPDDREAAAFYALSLLASEPHNDSTFANRKKAGAVLEKLFAEEPNHPGVAHYLIHTYDKPQLAAQGLSAARSYAKIAPASPHALHMPSHIFARLGLWRTILIQPGLHRGDPQDCRHAHGAQGINITPWISGLCLPAERA
jgi:hypothetical protein